MEGHKEMFYNNSMRYIAGDITLTQMSELTDFGKLSSYLQPRMASLQDVLRDRDIILTSFESTINNLYFWFMTIWDNNLLEKNSKYWRRFNITDPGDHIF